MPDSFIRKKNKMVEKNEFVKFDSVQVTTIYDNGKITYRRGIIVELAIDNDEHEYTLVGTMNSIYTKYTYGIVVLSQSDFTPPKNNIFMVKLTLLPCRIVLIEKNTCNSVWSYNKYTDSWISS